jgi:hypothetical protein
VVPVVRHPIGRLPSGRAVLGIADTVILNDPLAGQGGNSANRMADVLLRRVIEREARPFDEAWMRAVFDEMWSYAQYAVAFSNGLLEPLQPFQAAILAAAATHPQLGADFVHMFEDPRSAFPWFVDADAARRYLEAPANRSG